MKTLFLCLILFISGAADVFAYKGGSVGKNDAVRSNDEVRISAEQYDILQSIDADWIECNTIKVYDYAAFEYTDLEVE